MAKFVTAEEAVSKIANGSVIATSGFVGAIVPEHVLKALQHAFLEKGTPRDLTVMFAAGQGDGKELSLIHI